MYDPEYDRRYREEHRECIAKRKRNWYQANKDKRCVMDSRRRARIKYYKTERGRRLRMANAQNRRFLKRSVGIAIGKGITIEEWDAKIVEYNHRCAYCGERCALTMDHIIPLSKGGEHSIENVVPACAKCNSKKLNFMNWKPKIFEQATA